jgi:transposase
VVRGLLSDEEWAPFVIESGPKRGRPPADHRRVLDAVFWIARTGSPWRDLPGELGRWASVYKQFLRWTRSGLWDVLLETLAESGAVPDSVQIEGRRLGAIAQRARAFSLPTWSSRRAARRSKQSAMVPAVCWRASGHRQAPERRRPHHRAPVESMSRMMKASALIPSPIDQNLYAQSRKPMDQTRLTPARPKRVTPSGTRY